MGAPLTQTCGITAIHYGAERRFLVPSDALPALESALSSLLSPDPHAADGRYEPVSLYLDSPQPLLQTGGAGRPCAAARWRLRRYGDEPMAWAELKTVYVDGAVEKRRTAIALTGDGAPATTQHAPWFFETIHYHNLAPVCCIGGARHAFEGVLGGRMVRATLDTRLWAAPSDSLRLNTSGVDTMALMDGALLEIKGEGPLPGPLAGCIERLNLAPEVRSKFRLAQELLCPKR